MEGKIEPTWFIFSILENNFIEVNLPTIQFTHLKYTICKYTLFI